MSMLVDFHFHSCFANGVKGAELVVHHYCESFNILEVYLVHRDFMERVVC